MKKNKLSLFIASSFLLLLGACAADYDANPEAPDGRNPLQGEFKANIYGEPFTAEVKHFYDSTLNDARNLTISATQFNYDKDTSKYKMITLNIGHYEGPNVYYMSSGNARGYYIEKDGINLRNFSSTSQDTLGAITITGDQAAWVGNFSFMAINGTDTIYVGDGSFNIPK